MSSLIFTPGKIGPIEIKNRIIRASAYEGMCENHEPSEQLKEYHTALARGGVGMTSVAYASVCKSGLSFHRQLWMREEIVPGLKELTDSIHEGGAKACIQLGHCGNMSHRRYCGQRPVGASGGFNLYSPTFVHGLRKDEMIQIAKDYGNAVRLAKESGFDAVEIHAGHGYLISQFLSPYTNHRKDEFGGSLENRMKFMEMAMTEVMKNAGNDIAVMVKINTRDGFKGGMEVDECIEVAKKLEEMGVHCLVLSGGFVSRAPMYVMRGAMPIRSLAGYMPWKQLWWLRIGVSLFGKLLIKDQPYKEAFFYEDALKFRKALKMPLALVGGLHSRETIDMALNSGFEFVEMARPLVHDTEFVNKLRDGIVNESGCRHANYCVARIYNIDMQCHEHCKVAPRLQKELDRNMKRNEK
ncbi:MAG: NADH:flavin oxidoreductase [Bacteroidales bacterium]|nr:NADH:flavin oxidoreductase [Bacteroidales bacterium]